MTRMSGNPLSGRAATSPGLGGVKLGVGLRVRYEAMADVAQAADELGYESVWLPEHLVLPAAVLTDPTGHELDPSIPTLDSLMVLLSLGVATRRVRLGTWVYNLALRSPFVTARAVQTLDVLTSGRAVLGVGAGWIRGEYEAVGVDFATRGRRLDEAIEVLRVLWTEPEPSFSGEFFSFDPVRFGPKPAGVPIHVGGESPAALRRAARLGDGWIGMDHTPESAARQVKELDADIEVTVGANPLTPDEVPAYAAAGVDRIIVSPWRRSADAVEGLRRLAEELL